MKKCDLQFGTQQVIWFLYKAVIYKDFLLCLWFWNKWNVKIKNFKIVLSFFEVLVTLLQAKASWKWLKHKKHEAYIFRDQDFIFL